ncbi:nucleotidyltransferase domain-containing protein [Candidatus Bathyarchaeota archaeon]|nr:nucleotidyltransferase domain-containing protein [Candidatus Bathyarchaeota archaeon]
MDNLSLTSSLRKRVAREAALLLYTLQEKEFKQAKERAAKTLGVRILPTNLEVAEELDSIADEYEGNSRWERLIRMRREALEIMEMLKDFHPKLVGSVWRGTINKNSDIDIIVFSDNKEPIMMALAKKNLRITRVEITPAAKDGSGEATHIFLNLPSGDEVELVIRRPEDIDKEERCEIYGDVKKGLNINQLREVLKDNPLQRFIPKKKENFGARFHL